MFSTFQFGSTKTFIAEFPQLFKKVLGEYKITYDIPAGYPYSVHAYEGLNHIFALRPEINTKLDHISLHKELLNQSCTLVRQHLLFLS